MTTQSRWTSKQIKSRWHVMLENSYQKFQEKALAIKKMICDEEQKTLVLECSHCGLKHDAKDIDLLEVFEYVEPYSCSGGDYDRSYGYRFDCHGCGRWQKVLQNGRQFLSHSFLDAFKSVKKKRL